MRQDFRLAYLQMQISNRNYEVRIALGDGINTLAFAKLRFCHLARLCHSRFCQLRFCQVRLCRAGFIKSGFVRAHYVIIYACSDAVARILQCRLGAASAAALHNAHSSPLGGSGFLAHPSWLLAFSGNAGLHTL